MGESYVIESRDWSSQGTAPLKAGRRQDSMAGLV